MSALDSEDPYKVLGVARDAAQDVVKKAYRKLARKLHPDRGGDPEKLKRVNAAYHMVGDVKKRKLYDEFGSASTQSGFDADQARTWRQRGGGRQVNFDDPMGFEDLFGDLFRARARPSACAARAPTAAIDALEAAYSEDVRSALDDLMGPLGRRAA